MKFPSLYSRMICFEKRRVASISSIDMHNRVTVAVFLGQFLARGAIVGLRNKRAGFCVLR